MTNQSLLPVTQKDREAYLSLNMLPPEDAEAVRAGRWDGVTGMQVLARHRQDHTTPEPVLRWEGDETPSVTDADKQFAADWNYECRHCSEYEGDFEADLAAAVAEYREQSVRDWLARAGLGGVAGEPVAWIYEYGGGIVAVTATCYDPGVLKALGWTETPLYAHPPASPTAEVVEALSEERLLAELALLYNHKEDDSRQFTRWQMIAAIAHGMTLAAHPAEPKNGKTIWYRGWECGFHHEAASWGAEGWCAYKGGADIDAPTCSACTWEGLLSEIDDAEDETRAALAKVQP